MNKATMLYKKSPRGKITHGEETLESKVVDADNDRDEDSSSDLEVHLKDKWFESPDAACGIKTKNK